MRILSINPGSASLKYAIYKNSQVERRGQIKPSDLSSVFINRIDAIGIRIVHGGNKFTNPTLLTESALKKLIDLNNLAPLHNPPALKIIRDIQNKNNVPIIAVFDTMFHKTIPKHAATYALPARLNKELFINRYGFHGLAHEYMLNQYCRLEKTDKKNANLITLQLGSGCSACAIKGGQSTDTSMGFTPLEGLVMRTRSGDIDPGLISYIAVIKNYSYEKIYRILNEKSGLAGLTNTDGDMRKLLNSKSNDSQLAIDVFCYRIKKYIGAYLTTLNSADAIIFGGGIGENLSIIREKILSNMDNLNIKINPKSNKNINGKEGVINSSSSRVKIYVIRVDEEKLIMEYAKQIIIQGRKTEYGKQS